MTVPVSLITGITGQDGSYLTELLLENGHVVHGIIRRSSSFNTARIDHLINSDVYNKRMFLHYGDVVDFGCISRIIQNVRPDYLFHLAAQSHVKVSFEMPEYTADTDALGTLRLLEAVRMFSPHTRVYNASTSELFGGVMLSMPKGGYNENSPFYPRSPYGVAKLYSHWIARNYREAYKLHVCNGILFNHSSPRRGMTFLTRKVTSWCGRNWHKLTKGLISDEDVLEVGNIHAYRDEGHAIDYVAAMVLMMQHDLPDDYVIATGETHSVKEWIDNCFSWMNLSLEWRDDNCAYLNDKLVVRSSGKYVRPTEVDYLLGDSSKARRVLRWAPTRNYHQLVDDMMRHDTKNNLCYV